MFALVDPPRLELGVFALFEPLAPLPLVPVKGDAFGLAWRPALEPGVFM